MNRSAEVRTWPLLAFALLVGLQAIVLTVTLGGDAVDGWLAWVGVASLALTVLLAVAVVSTLARTQARARLAQRTHLQGEAQHPVTGHLGGRVQRLRQARSQRQRGQRRAFALEAQHQRRTQPLRQQLATTLAAGQQLAAGRQAADGRLGRIGDRTGQAFGDLVHQVGTFEKLLLDPGFEHGRR